MKKLLVAFLLLLLLGIAVEVSAQEVLKDKIPIAGAVCSVDDQYVMGKGKPIERDCVLFSDGTDQKGWVLIYDKYNKPAVVVELDPATNGQVIVWRRGQISL